MDKIKNLIGYAIFAAIAGLIIWRYPINGWTSLVWLAGMIMMGIIRAPHEQRNKDNTITESRQTGVENALLAGVVIGSYLLPVIYLLSGVFNAANYSLPLWTSIAGIVILAIGLWLFWRSHVDLGRNWSVTLKVREDHNLTTGGVYTHLRHPMYSAIYLVYIAQALLLHNWIAGLAGLVFFTIMFLVRVPREEAMMREQFGEAYEEFCRERGRLVPKFF